MRRALALLVPALVLAPAAPASAGWVKAQRIAGPGRLLHLGDASLGPDGTGVVTYVQQVGSRRHHDRDRVGVVVRLRAGRWGRRTVLARGGVWDIRAAAGTDGRLAVAWIAHGAVWGMVSDGGALAGAVQLGAGHPSQLDVRMDDAGDGYAVWTQDGGGGRDVRAARVSRTRWTPLGAALDVDPNRSAGTGRGRPRFAVRPDGDGVVAWGETAADGSVHVFARRLSATDFAAAPVDVAAGADSADVDAEPGGAWIAFRQDVGGRSRSLTRRFTDGGLGPVVALDGGSASANPTVAVGGATGGVAAVGAANGTVLASQMTSGAFGPPMRVDPAAAGSPPAPVVAWGSARGEGAVAYRVPAPGGDAAVYGRLADQGQGFGSQSRLSRSGPGPVTSGSLRIGSAATGDAIVAMLQGTHPGHRRLEVALADREPDAPSVRGGWVSGPRPVLRWTPGLDVFGAQRFRVALDGRHVGTTRGSSLRSRRSVADGRHRLRVTAVDRRGQTATSAARTVRVDSSHPRVTVTATRSGRVLHLRVRRSDSGSGVASIVVRWGDGTRSTARRGPFRHRYAGAGTHRVRVTVSDRAGNRTVRRLRA